MRVSEPRRSLPRAASVLLISAAVAVLSVPAAQSASPARPAAPAAPTDLYRGQQWTLGALHIPRAWKLSRGNGVTVAVLDTGVDGHQPDLTGRVVDGPDYTGRTRKPGGKYWGRHGTEMASIIAGHGHGPGAAAGVMGVAPDAKILSIRVTWELTDPIRSDHTQVDHSRDAVANGIRYAADHGAQVISMSLGGGNLFYNGNAAEEAAIEYAIGKGAVLVASAGNDGSGANRRNYPAAYPGVIAVGAVDRTFKPAKFTNRHTYISVAAPGVEIVSADVSGQGYILGTGTSSSAAFVAGMAALVKARYPRLTADEVKQALEEGTTHRPPDGRSIEIGTGVVDAYDALRTAARINKAEHGGAAVETPQQTTTPAPRPVTRHGPDLMLIAVLSGGGTLILLSLILGWRQRRRRPARDEDDEDMPEEAPVPAGSFEASSWHAAPIHTAPTPAAPTPPRTGRSPWEPRPEGIDDSPWERHLPEPSPWERESPAESTRWDGPSEPSADAWRAPPPAETWEAPPAEAWEAPRAESWDASPAVDETPPDPEPYVPEPESYAPQPESYVPEPESYAPQPEPYAPEPQTYVATPEPYAPEPEPYAPEPVRSELHDPLSDGPIDSSDIGTPLADESWDSIRRGFDRLKDASNWESLAKEDIAGADRLPAADAFDETAGMPIVDPDDDGA